MVSGHHYVSVFPRPSSAVTAVSVDGGLSIAYSHCLFFIVSCRTQQPQIEKRVTVMWRSQQRSSVESWSRK